MTKAATKPEAAEPKPEPVGVSFTQFVQDLDAALVELATNVTKQQNAASERVIAADGYKQCLIDVAAKLKAQVEAVEGVTVTEEE